MLKVFLSQEQQDLLISIAREFIHTAASTRVIHINQNVPAKSYLHTLVVLLLLLFIVICNVLTNIKSTYMHMYNTYVPLQL